MAKSKSYGKSKVPTPEQIKRWKEKAAKWDALDKQISKFYIDEDGEPIEDEDGGDLADIGELSAIAFGYL
jgi:hypothetical protein